VVFKSPLTGIYAESSCGGIFADELKKTGYDGLIIRGKASKPIYIWLTNEGIEFRDAEHLWGRDIYEAHDRILEETARKAGIMVIGQAGENLVPMSGIGHNGRHTRMAGRCGGGAVMGSKNLKAVVVKGDWKPPAPDLEGLKKSIRRLVPQIKEATLPMKEHGTAVSFASSEEKGNLPLKNWFQGRWPQARKIDGSVITETILTGKSSCRYCPIACGRKIKMEDNPYGPVIESAGPEYESIGALGGLTLVDDLAAIVKANELCNRFGLDTISTGSAIAFAMEAYEKGIISQKDCDGLELNWGNGKAVVEMVKKIGGKEGLGQVLGQGVRSAAKELGGNSVEFAIHTKGLELPMQDPRCYHSQALSYATSNRGGCHLAGNCHSHESYLHFEEFGYKEPFPRHQLEGKAEFVVKLQNYNSLIDSLITCKFLQIGFITPNHQLEWYKLVTGRDISMDEFLQIGDRIYNLKRIFNVRCGISRKDDTLPLRILTHKRKGEGLVVNMPHLGALLSDYYEYRNWSEDGIPTGGKLKELGLEDYLL
ncbi:MAG: aldehyde ferredoxin oxidoreductase family protein, partial [Desulfobacteraceae bacterium]|nr:aldehyde ferredoxin oxidoreductase family protein [Desulfobacteraceae bacterium]